MYQNTYYRPPTQFSVFPPVLKNLLILNGLFYMAKIGVEAAIRSGEPGTFNLGLAWVLNYLALYPFGAPEIGYSIYGGIGPIPGFWPWQLVTYGFMHGSFGHLFFNMFALWMFGVQLENTWGSRRFAVFYFVCVVGAGLIQSLVMYGDPIPTVGASGGVYGILLAYGMMFPNQPIYLYFLFPIKAKWLVIGMGVFALFSGISGTQAGVAHFAHLGGMIFGLLLILYWRGKLPIQPKSRMYS